jgi:hypothetical protein
LIVCGSIAVISIAVISVAVIIVYAVCAAALRYGQEG